MHSQVSICARFFAARSPSRLYHGELGGQHHRKKKAAKTRAPRMSRWTYRSCLRPLALAAWPILWHRWLTLTLSGWGPWLVLCRWPKKQGSTGGYQILANKYVFGKSSDRCGAVLYDERRLLVTARIMVPQRKIVFE